MRESRRSSHLDLTLLLTQPASIDAADFKLRTMAPTGLGEHYADRLSVL